MKPLWQELHEGLIDDIKTVMDDIKLYEKWMTESDYAQPMHHEYMECLEICKVKLSTLRKEYKNRYGQYPKPRQLKGEV